MQKRWMIIIATLVVLTAAGTGAYIWLKMRANDVENTTGSGVTSDRSIALNDDPSSRSSIPLNESSDGKNDNSNNDESENPLKVTDSSPGGQLGNAATGSSNSSSSNDDTGSSSANDFSQYAQYQDKTEALFGDVKIGDGAEAGNGKTLHVIYKGWLTNGVLFDQYLDTNKPFAFKIGDHQVITGWEQGLGSAGSDGKYMKVGGIRRVIVPPAVGYGAEAKGKIPANSLLIFDVQLLSVE